MTKAEIKAKEEKEAAVALLKGLKDEAAAKAYIEANIYARALKKSFIAAYVEVFHKGEDNTWLNKCFTSKQKKVVVTDNSGNVVYNTKTGKPKTKFVKDDSSKEKSFDKTAAIKAFAKAYDITYKPTGFTAKEKRTEPIYDVFEGLM